MKTTLVRHPWEPMVCGKQKILDGKEGISPDNINPGMKESSELGPVNS